MSEQQDREQLQLLSYLVQDEKPHLIKLVERLRAGGQISPVERQALIFVLIDGIVAHLDEHGEPTALAKAYDNAIDLLTKFCPLHEEQVDDAEVERLLNPSSGQ